MAKKQNNLTKKQLEALWISKVIIASDYDKIQTLQKKMSQNRYRNLLCLEFTAAVRRGDLPATQFIRQSSQTSIEAKHVQQVLVNHDQEMMKWMIEVADPEELRLFFDFDTLVFCFPKLDHNTQIKMLQVNALARGRDIAPQDYGSHGSLTDYFNRTGDIDEPLFAVIIYAACFGGMSYEQKLEWKPLIDFFDPREVTRVELTDRILSTYKTLHNSELRVSFIEGVESLHGILTDPNHAETKRNGITLSRSVMTHRVTNRSRAYYGLDKIESIDLDFLLSILCDLIKADEIYVDLDGISEDLNKLNQDIIIVQKMRSMIDRLRVDYAIDPTNDNFDDGSRYRQCDLNKKMVVA